jgi:hypothetical protein
MLCDYLGLPSIVHARLPAGEGYMSNAYSFLRHDSGGWGLKPLKRSTNALSPLAQCSPTGNSLTGITDVRYWTSVLGIEHPRPSPLDEGLDNTVLLALQSGTEIAHC